MVVCVSYSEWCFCKQTNRQIQIYGAKNSTETDDNITQKTVVEQSTLHEICTTKNINTENEKRNKFVSKEKRKIKWRGLRIDEQKGA